MTDLVICLSKDEKTWPHIHRLIKDKDWNNIFVITDEECKGKFKPEKNVGFITVDYTKPAPELIQELINELKNKFSDFEVALNLVSGTGKEHMVILSAILKLGVGLRLVAVTREGVKEL